MLFQKRFHQIVNCFLLIWFDFYWALFTVFCSKKYNKTSSVSPKFISFVEEQKMDYPNLLLILQDGSYEDENQFSWMKISEAYLSYFG